MAYKKFRADQLFTGFTLLDNTHVLITGEDGTIHDIVSAEQAGDDVEQLPGILTPGFINCHCHLELSHMRNRIPSGKGLTDFIFSVMRSPQVEQVEKNAQMALADQEMYRNGIVAVGDISNQLYSAAQKKISPLRWHTFLEITNLDDEKAPEKINNGLQLVQSFKQTVPPPTEAVLSPHAIYSVSQQTFRLINEHTAHQTISIHNQECTDEDLLLTKGNGRFLQFYESIGRKTVPVVVSGKSSVQTWLPYFNNGQTIVLVHNTYMSEADIVWANDFAAHNGLHLIYCLCPNANLYIEERLPPVDLFIKHNCTMVLGTDSYGSNWQLSIAKEIAAIHERLPHIAPAELLRWSTLNAAKAFNWESDLGSFEKGKKPGIVLVSNDLNNAQRIL
ncbi:MAG: amidohydrolase family protein [Agriterribacter sp.]